MWLSTLSLSYELKDAGGGMGSAPALVEYSSSEGGKRPLGRSRSRSGGGERSPEQENDAKKIKKSPVGGGMCGGSTITEQLEFAQRQLALLEQQRKKLMEQTERHERKFSLKIKIPGAAFAKHSITSRKRRGLKRQRASSEAAAANGNGERSPRRLLQNLGLPSPGLSDVFGRQINPEDLQILGPDFGRVTCAGADKDYQSLSPLLAATAPQLASHMQSLRIDFLARSLRPLLHRLFTSSSNRGGLFNIPVDPLALKIPDYLERVREPMDLGRVKGKLATLGYREAEDMARDVRLVFTNAMEYNPPAHAVHQYAQQLLSEFETEFSKLQQRLERDSHRRSEHNCQLCQGQTCALCGDKCLRLEPSVLICSGPCNQRIKRGGIFFAAHDGCRLWCQKCHQQLPAEVGEGWDGEGSILYKKDLLRRKFDEEISEAWVQCDRCQCWVHQVCALFNARANAGGAEMTCPRCRLQDAAGALERVRLSPKQEPVAKPEPKLEPKLEVPHEATPANGINGTTGTTGTTGTPPMYSAAHLPTTPMSEYIEQRLHSLLAELGEAETAPSVSVRVVSSVVGYTDVSSVVTRAFQAGGGQPVASQMEHRSKALAMFQKLDGVDVCLFSMYVQEYGIDCPDHNARRVYVAYLDSVEYFRPRTARTHVYHELLVAYLDWVRRRGFTKVHIWSCPPQRGNNFIFWCHPAHQRTPTRDRLVEWYRTMLRRAEELGIVESVENLHTTHFQEVTKVLHLHRQHQSESLLVRMLCYLCTRQTVVDFVVRRLALAPKILDKLSLARPIVPPVFEGEYWTDEILRLNKLVERKNDSDFVAEHLSAVELCRSALAEVQTMPNASVFQTPVDPIAHRCPDYYDVIKKPMDLSTVASKLDAGKYSTAGAFVEDLRLVFANAMRYNPPKHPVHSYARSISVSFERNVKRLQKMMKDRLGKVVSLEEISLEDELEEVELANGKDASSMTIQRTESNVGFHSCKDRSMSYSSLSSFYGSDNALRKKYNCGPPSESGSITLRSRSMDFPMPAKGEATVSCGAGAAAVISSAASVASSDGASVARAGAAFPSGKEDISELEVDEEVVEMDTDTDVVGLTCQLDNGDGKSVMSTATPATPAPRESEGRKNTPQPNPMQAPAAVVQGAGAKQEQQQWLDLPPPPPVTQGPAAVTQGPATVPRAADADGSSTGSKAEHSEKSREALNQQTVSGNKLKWLLSQLCKSVDRMKRDLMVVNLAPPDAPLANDRWEAAVRVTTRMEPATCFDPDTSYSRALVDSRHTFLEMCQFRHYQFDSLRRAKHSSAMVLYHLHRPECHSLNPFCSRCSGAVKHVRYHCGKCNYDVCKECQAAMSCLCEDGHLLTPMRVTFSATDNEGQDYEERELQRGTPPLPAPPAQSKEGSQAQALLWQAKEELPHEKEHVGTSKALGDVRVQPSSAGDTTALHGQGEVLSTGIVGDGVVKAEEAEAEADAASEGNHCEAVTI
ncbi:unnamed protein product [Chrysoparadoxa australica]